MAAYAALVSLMHIIDQIQHHPRPPFYLDKKHAECLIKKIAFLQDFLEAYSHVRNEEADRLQNLIADAAYAAEDVIETHVVDQILAQSTRHGRRISSVDFYRDLERVIQDMSSIKKEVMEIKQKMESVQDIRSSLMSEPGSSRSPSIGQNNMVGRDDVVETLMDKLTSEQCLNLQVIPIVGMGGIGKTMLARNVYDNSVTLRHFDIHAWVTISQEYRVHEILLQLLCCQETEEKRESLNKKTEGELGVMLHKNLHERRYLIIMDDLWSIEAWEKVKFFFPDNNNGSRMILTTRISSVASYFTSGHGDRGVEMNFLDDDMSWNLFCKIVFGEYGCPLELEKVGKMIARNCKGLPLAIVVIGGHLANSEQTLEYWEYIGENLNANLEDNELCLNILYMSYNHLPVHLKPCFLYMGIFKEDYRIRVPKLIMLWVAEGFLRPINGKILEEVAEKYLEELVDRNLILVVEKNYDGAIESCEIHDLLRDLCLREAEKDKFLCIRRLHPNNFLQGIKMQRRVVIHTSSSEELEINNDLYGGRGTLQSTTITRSLTSYTSQVLPYRDATLFDFRLLRILSAPDEYSSYSLLKEYSLQDFIRQLVNLRFIEAEKNWRVVKFKFPYSPHLFWNLQTLCIHKVRLQTVDISKIPLLRNVQVDGCHIPNPRQDDFVLRNLQTLFYVTNFRCSEKMVEKIFNIKKLKISYRRTFMGSRYCLNNLSHLQKLESLVCNFSTLTNPIRSDLLHYLTFPHSLKELALHGCRLHWEDISTMIGPLPLLQVLKLDYESFIGPAWETVEGQFQSLKCLEIQSCYDLEKWMFTDNPNFPCLDHLVLRHLVNLKEIPSDIGNIPTLRLIELRNCSYSAIVSAEDILKEVEGLGIEDVQVRVEVWQENYEEIKSFASWNFEVLLADEELAFLERLLMSSRLRRAH